MMNNNIGLVLEGGAMRGIFTAGVTDLLMENGIDFPGCVGVSAGAAFGCNIKSKQPGRVLRYNLRFCKDKRYCSFKSLMKTGDLFGAEFCYKTIPDELDVFNRRVFEENPMKFWVVCTDAETGKAHYQQLEKVDGDFYEWIRASASMPLVSRVVKVGGGAYLDGGIADSIPLSFMESKYEKNVVVLTRSREYQKEPVSWLTAYRLSLRNYPNIVEAIKNRWKMYNEEREYIFEQERAGRALVICPDEPLKIGRICHEPREIKETYELGRRAAQAKLSEIERFINDN